MRYQVGRPKRLLAFAVSIILSIFLLMPEVAGNAAHNLASLWFSYGILHNSKVELKQAEIFERTSINWLPSYLEGPAKNNLVRILIASNQIEEVFMIQQDLDFTPDSALNLELGNLYWMLGDSEAAYYHWEKVPYSGSILINRAFEYKEREQIEEAIETFKLGWSLNPVIVPTQNAEVFMGFAQLFVEADDIEFAIEVYEKIRDSGYRSAGVDMIIGKLYYHELKDFVSAEAYFRHAQQIDPEFYRVELWLGLALVQQDKLDEAIDIFQGGILDSPLDGLLYFELGRAFLKTGNKNMATIYLRKSIDFKPPPEAWEFGYVDQAIKLLETLED